VRAARLSPFTLDMADQVQTAKVELVTIIAPYELQVRITADLARLGAKGYTLARVNGRGHHGIRQAGVLDASNVLFETLVTPDIARKILAHVAREYADLGVLAYAQPVEAVPPDRFA
jgi:hypothetical protein